MKDVSSVKFSACHDGYKKLKKKVLHCRYWSVSNDSIKIVDNITGKGIHKIRSIFPLHPGIVVGNVQGESISLKIGKKKVKVKFEGMGKLKIIESQYHPEFGLSIDNKHLIYDYHGNLPSKITTRISW